MSGKSEEDSPNGSPDGDSEEKIAPPPKRSLGSRISRVVWDRDDKSEVERKFVLRLDLGLMTMICVSYWVKYLDQANMSNAYVSGMKEDLDFTGNEYNTLISCWTAGYTLGQLFTTILMVKIGPHYFLPTCELAWTALVMCGAAATRPQTLMGLRFFIGLLESAAYPGGLWLLGSWYNKAELGKRSVIFICCSSAGFMFSGYLQTAVLNLDGVGGLAGWAWLFNKYHPFMDGVIGIPIGLAGYFVLPGTPDRPNPLARWWIRPQDLAIGRARMEAIGRAPQTGFSTRKFVSVFRSPYLWMFTAVYPCYLLGLSSYAYFNLYLKSTGRYTVPEINVIPTGGFALQIVTAVFYSWVSDAIRSRWQVIMFAGSIAFLGNVILAIWPSSNHPAIFAGFFLSYTVVSAGALTLAWANELVSESSAEHRAITIGFLSAWACVFNAWVPNLVFPASEAPRYEGKGYKVTVALWGAFVVGIGLIALYEKAWGHKQELTGQDRAEEVERVVRRERPRGTEAGVDI